MIIQQLSQKEILKFWKNISLTEEEYNVIDVTSKLYNDVFLDNKQSSIFDLIIEENVSHKLYSNDKKEMIGEIYYNDLANVIDYVGSIIYGAEIIFFNIFSATNQYISPTKKHLDTQLWIYMKPNNKKEKCICKIYYDKKIKKFVIHKKPGYIGRLFSYVLDELLVILNDKFKTDSIRWS